MMSYVHARACARGWHAPSHHPPPPHPPIPPPPRGGPPGIIQNSIALETNRDISIPFEDLKSVETSQPMGWVYNLVGGWVG